MTALAPAKHTFPAASRRPHLIGSTDLVLVQAVNGWRSDRRFVATIVIGSYGSRGDIMPLTDVGSRLRELGHRVVMTSNGELDAEARACGLEVRGLSIDIDADLEGGGANALKVALEVVKPAGFKRLGNAFLDAVSDVDADLVMLTPFTELPGHALAEARGIPSIGLRFQPISATSEYPPSLLGAWSAGAVGNRAAGGLAAAAVDRIYGGAVRDFRDRLGLPRRSARALRRQRTAEEWPILNGYSPTVLPRPADWRPGIEVAGYWWSQHHESWTPPQELIDFLAAGPPPAFVGFGSLMVPAAERERLSRVVREAALASGLRLIVQAGGAGLVVPNDEHTLTIGAAPYDWLFDWVAAVVHSCGAGTTAAGLRAGVPRSASPRRASTRASGRVGSSSWGSVRQRSPGRSFAPMRWPPRSAPRSRTARIASAPRRSRLSWLSRTERGACWRRSTGC